MREKDYIKKELQDMAPFLAARKKPDPFEAPEGYFDAFPIEVQARLQKGERQESLSPLFLSRRWSPLLAVCCLLLLVAGFFYWGKSPVTSVPQTYSDVLLEHIDEDILLEAYLEERPVNASTKKQKDEAVENYLLEQTDESFLSEEI